MATDLVFTTGLHPGKRFAEFVFSDLAVIAAVAIAEEYNWEIDVLTRYEESGILRHQHVCREQRVRDIVVVQTIVDGEVRE